MLNWVKRKWRKFKAWIIGSLVALGIVSGGILYAEPVTFTYTRATAYTDGTSMPLTEIAETRLYCDGSATAISSESGADQSLVGDLSVGTHTCFATHVDIYGRESLPSNSVTRVVSPPGTGPNPPVMDP